MTIIILFIYNISELKARINSTFLQRYAGFNSTFLRRYAGFNFKVVYSVDNLILYGSGGDFMASVFDVAKYILKKGKRKVPQNEWHDKKATNAVHTTAFIT